MTNEFRFITTEQVSKYHPDKYADQISDKITTYLLELNPFAKVAVETLVKDYTVILAGEVSGVHIDKLALHTLVRDVAKGLNYHVDDIQVLIGQQSNEIKRAVEQQDLGAGDQGIMFGYATRETETYLPLGLHVANTIIKTLESISNTGEDTVLPILYGDAKTQVTVDTETNLISSIVISVCYPSHWRLEYIRDYIKNLIIKRVRRECNLDLRKTRFYINPSGAWHQGGPVADTGLTGRKIVADQYGAYMPVGGGAFSGKDLTKVDRSATYMARIKAVEILENNPELNWVKVHVGYAIGQPYPVSLSVLSDRGEVEVTDDLIESFKVGNLVNYFKGIDLYELSKGNHFRDINLLKHGDKPNTINKCITTQHSAKNPVIRDN